MEKFVIDKEKTVTAMLYVVERIPRIRYHKLLKIIYFADLKHLAKYGRPITGDQYVAMNDGPVASWLYDLLKKKRGENFWHLFEVGWWKHLEAKATPDMTYFSKSDIECLDESIKENKDFDFGILRDKSHDAAWMYTWNNVGKNKEINISKLAEVSGASKEMIEYLEKKNQYTITKTA